MSNDDDQLKRRYKEFLDLLPMTTAIAGLSVNPGPRSLTNEQIEARAQIFMSAYKLARKSVLETIRNGG